MAKDPYRFFRIEARELIDQLSSGVMALEAVPAEAAGLASLLRLAHTLKGAARVVKQGEIADGAHALEDVLAPYREGGQVIPRERVNSLLATLDAITASLAKLPAPDGDKASAAPATHLARTEPGEVDELLDGLGEIGRELAGLRELSGAVERGRDLLASLAERLAGPLSQPAALAKAHGMADELAGLMVGIERGLGAGVERIERELRQVRDSTDRLRLVPAASVFGALERASRDAAQSAGKSVNFEASGGEVLLDGQVLDQLQNALVQLVRNAIAHGIETVAERQSLGKPAAGNLRLQVVRQGYRVVFRCSDDGRGIDFAAVRLAALRQGASRPELERLDAAALLKLLLQGGISTASAVTQLAGRGVGLDVVREAMHSLNGEVQAETVTNRGTTVALTVPVSLAAVAALLVELEGQLAAIPLESVRCTQRLGPADIARSAEGDAIMYEGKLIPLRSPRLSNRPAERANGVRRYLSAVILASGANVAAVGVDRLLGTETIVLRPLPALAMADPMVLGSYFDAEGTPRLVLDPGVLTTARHGSVSLGPVAPASRHPILIVDDSLTTRMLEQSILESAGLPVETAASAEEALEMVKHKRYALFLVDVEMPGMNGFGFVERTRADPQLSEVPCILVTSCDSAEDRQRGASAGAAAYIVKSQFDQTEFLRHVHRLVRQ